MSKIDQAIKSGKLIPLSKLLAEFSPDEQAEIKERSRYIQASMAIRRIRKTLKLTQQELATKMNVKREVIARAESGKHNVTLETLYHIAEATNHHLDIHFT